MQTAINLVLFLVSIQTFDFLHGYLDYIVNDLLVIQHFEVLICLTSLQENAYIDIYGLKEIYYTESSTESFDIFW